MRMSIQFRQPLGTYALSLAWLLAPAAQAQLSGSAGLLSNYLYRGMSLSDDKPAARLAMNYDGDGGWYAGGQVVSGQLAVERHRSAQWTGFAGYAQRLPSGLAWEAGVTAYAFPHHSDWSFREVYAGLSGETLGGRLHYSPDYLGLGERTLYGELNGGWMLGPRWQAFWHGGHLHSYDNARSNRSEARIGLSTGHQGWHVQLSLDLVRMRGAPATYVYYGNAAPSGADWRRKTVLTVARSF
ncbi:TorF family putative porin [Oxalobacteraceae bacterium A2-2]